MGGIFVTKLVKDEGELEQRRLHRALYALERRGLVEISVAKDGGWVNRIVVKTTDQARKTN